MVSGQGGNLFEENVRKCYQLQTTYDYYIQGVITLELNILRDNIREHNNQKPKPLKMKIIPVDQREVIRGIAEMASCGDT